MTAAERLEPLVDTIAYAMRVVAGMPRETEDDRRRRAERFQAILDEWHSARRRWKILACAPRPGSVG